VSWQGGPNWKRKVPTASMLALLDALEAYRVEYGRYPRIRELMTATSRQNGALRRSVRLLRQLGLMEKEDGRRSMFVPSAKGRRMIGAAP
jgi:hypothetical protein